MPDSAGSRFAELITTDMAARRFHPLPAMHPVNQDAVITMFSAERIAWSGAYTFVVVIASGLELMQNADALPEFARARVAASVKAWRDDREDCA